MFKVVIMLIIFKALSTFHLTKQIHLDYLFEQSSNQQEITPSTWLAGIMINATNIHNNTWDLLAALNCKHDFGIQLIVKDNREWGLRTMHDFMVQHKSYTIGGCNAPFILSQEDKSIWTDGIPNNRVDRISILRDYQRDILRSKFTGNEQNGIVILADLDLKELPSIDEIVEQVESLRDITYPLDAICSNGRQLRKMKDKETGKRTTQPFYYDIFGTVFLPDTFSFPTHLRLIKKLYEGEEAKLVRSRKALAGKFTQHHIFKYIENEAQKSAHKNLQVRSCFGGLAMYRARTYFDERCKYQLLIGKKDIEVPDEDNISESIMRYANRDDKRPCEHVVLHDCLGRKNTGFNIAVNPRLLTLWEPS